MLSSHEHWLRWEKSLTSEQKRHLAKLARPRLNKYIPLIPTPKQAAFLSLDDYEAFYGGAGGGGKTVALAMAALQYVTVPGYHALLLRRTFTDLSQPECLMPLIESWLVDTDAVWRDKRKTWLFPSGATVSFGYCEHPGDERRYKSAQFQFIGWDELTEFARDQYEFLQTRCRRPKWMNVPLRIRAASNPGGPGHEWVKEQFVNPATRGERIFLPARIDDNPYLDGVEYRKRLANIHPVLREQILAGNWDVMLVGNFFKREWFQLVSKVPARMRVVRYWDKAASDNAGDWTAGVKMGEQNGIYFVLDIIRVRRSSAEVEKLIQQTAIQDGIGTVICMEEEGGSSGKDVSDHYRRQVLKGYAFYPIRSTGSKTARATPLANAAAAGNVKILCNEQSTWIPALLMELDGFPLGHDDQVDAMSGAMNVLSRGTGEAFGQDDMPAYRSTIPGLLPTDDFYEDMETTIPGL